MRGSASTAVLIYFACTSGGLAYLLMAYGTKIMDAKRRPGAQEWAHLLRLMARSDAAMFIVVNWVFAALSMFMYITTILFLGRLSSRESGLLLDRLVKYSVFKLMFVSALRLPPTADEMCEWLAWFAVAGFMRIFIGMARDRLELLAAAPSAPLTAHVRAVSLVLIILARDAAAIRDLWGSAPTSVAHALGIGGVHEFTAALGLTTAAATVAGGEADVGQFVAGVGGGSVSRFVLCAYDLAVVMLEGIKTLIKYGVHCWDAWAARRATAQIMAAPADDPLPPAAGRWEGKGSLLFHVELAADVVTHVMTILHYLHMWCLHGFTLHLVDMVLLMDVRAVAASLYRRVKMYCEYRTATYRLHHAFPDAHPGDEDPCSICMEPMQVAKQLPCGHHFHLACLRAWLQQSGAHTFTCPNCRQPLLIAPPTAPRRPTILDRARLQLQRQTTILMLQVVRLLLEADQSVMQHQIRRRLRRRQEAIAAARRRQGGRSLAAHEEPEGSGESSHPAPVSCFQKLARRFMGWSRGRPGQARALGDGVGGASVGGAWRRLARLGWRPRAGQQAEVHGQGQEDVAVADDAHRAGLRVQQGLTNGARGLHHHHPWYAHAPDGGTAAHETVLEEEELVEEAGGAGDPSSWGYWTDEEEEEGIEEENEEEQEEEEDAGEEPEAGEGRQEAEVGQWRGQAFSQGVAVGPENSQPLSPVMTRRRWASLAGADSDVDLPYAHPQPSRHRHTSLQQHVHGIDQPQGTGCGGPSCGTGAGRGRVATGAAGDGARQARRARVALRRLAGPSQEVPLWSVDAVQRAASQVARSIRSSLAHGDSRAAIAGTWAPDGEEVCSGWAGQHAVESN